MGKTPGGVFGALRRASHAILDERRKSALRYDLARANPLRRPQKPEDEFLNAEVDPRYGCRADGMSSHRHRRAIRMAVVCAHAREKSSAVWASLRTGAQWSHGTFIAARARQFAACRCSLLFRRGASCRSKFAIFSERQI